MQHDVLDWETVVFFKQKGTFSKKEKEIHTEDRMSCTTPGKILFLRPQVATLHISYQAFLLMEPNLSIGYLLGPRMVALINLTKI